MDTLNKQIIEELDKLAPHDFSFLKNYHDEDKTFYFPYMLVGQSRIIVIDEFNSVGFSKKGKSWLKKTGVLDDFHSRLIHLSSLLPKIAVQGALVTVAKDFTPYFTHGLLVSPLMKFSFIAQQSQLHYDAGGRLEHGQELKSEILKVLKEKML